MVTERKPAYDNTNTGALFANDKQGNERRPDYTGKVNIEGKEYRLAAWIREAASCGQYLSVRASEFDQPSRN